MDKKSSTKLTYSRTVRFIGRNAKSGKIETVPDVLCFRKGMDRRSSKVALRGCKEAVGLVSSIGLSKAKNAQKCKFWCHCFKDPEPYIGNKTGMLLSESDFVDPAFIKIYRRSKKFKWDFFYFTSGGRHGRKFKGTDVFGESLDLLCGKLKLRGLVVKYMKSKRPFLKKEKMQIAKYSSLLTIKQKKFSPSGIAKIMSKTRFGFFPNTNDCSPLMISESLLRGCPVLVNTDIIGGWKYVNDNTGCLYDPYSQDILEERVEYILSNDFYPREEYMLKYGYLNTSKRFAKTAKKHIKGFKRFDLIGLDGTYHKMKRLLK